MSERVAPTIAELIERPELALDVAPDEARRLLLKLAALTEATRIAAGHARPQGNGNGGTLLTAQEAGERLGLTAEQVYRRADRWPFTRRLGPKTLRFDAAGLELYLGRSRRS